MTVWKGTFMTVWILDLVSGYFWEMALVSEGGKLLGFPSQIFYHISIFPTPLVMFVYKGFPCILPLVLEIFDSLKREILTVWKGKF